ncbi:MAG TPA: SDR family NAD(P)-dependent oxidoreductase [Stellaceae bacterium]|nr:SDR family NAD(P)-dependent oxidoreductase [Stellaceae bacterium]
MTDSAERVVMISGASRGIGAALARCFAADGWRLSLGARSPFAAPADALVHPYEAEDPTAARGWVDATLERFNRIDCLICNAGVLGPVTLEDGSAEALDRMWAVNARAPFLLAQAALPSLKQGGRGRVVIVASLSGKRVRNLNAGYQMTKFAAVGLAHAIRRAGWEHGVRATALCPGYVRTDMALALGAMAEDAMSDPDEIAALVLHVVGMSNTASMAELAVNCAFEPVF